MQRLNWKHLTAFEAVARHRNFTLAARELNVQQPSVSRRVAELEADLGTQLLIRARPVSLTAEGALLARAVTNGLAQVTEAITQIKAKPDKNSVVVDTTIGFASCYLMQRLAAFRSDHPNIAIELVSRDQNDSYRTAHSDIVIAFDTPDRLPKGQTALIFPERLVPVARPESFAPHPRTLQSLAGLPLLHLSTEVHSQDWERYFIGSGVSPPTPKADQRFTSFMVYLQAALNGEGVILGWESLFQGLLDQGQLVRMADSAPATDRGYFACLTERAATNASARELWTWLAALEGPDGLNQARQPLSVRTGHSR